MTKSQGAVVDGTLPWIARDDDPGTEAVDSPRTKLVALCLARERSATLSELQSALGEPRLTLLQILGVLVDRGLVERVEGTYHYRDDAGAELSGLEG